MYRLSMILIITMMMTMMMMMMKMMMMTSYFPTAASMFLYNASETPIGQFE